MPLKCTAPSRSSALTPAGALFGHTTRPSDELEDYYRGRTVLGVNVLPEDVARAVLHFASEERSGKSTGNILNVDGGVSAAFPR